MHFSLVLPVSPLSTNFQMSGVLVPPTPAATVAAGIALPLVSGILVALRFYSRRARHANLYIEDWLTVPAWVCTYVGGGPREIEPDGG